MLIIGVLVKRKYNKIYWMNVLEMSEINE